MVGRINTFNGREIVHVAMIGTGGMARHHTRQILEQQDSTQIRAVCEPSAHAYEAFCELYDNAGLKPPPNVPKLDQLLARYGAELDAAFIVTPHKFHFEHASACLEAGIDVLLEKPMVMTAAEAEKLIALRNRTGRLLVVSFNGSLSPQVRTAVNMLRSGELGQILNVHATVWQSWKQATAHTWRQAPEISGGGFLFDTGAHLLNTVSDLVGEDFVEVAAWLDNRGAPVDILGTIMARTASDILVTLSGCGETVESCHSDVRVFCTNAILRTGVWGELLELWREGEEGFSPVEVPPSRGQWQQFLDVRDGKMPNPCPPEVGLRMAKLWDAVRTSAGRGGQLVQC